MSLEDEQFRSILERLSVAKFGMRTAAVENVITVDVARTNILANNPNRIFWMAINEGPNLVRLTSDPDISATSGWVLAANGGVISFWWEEDGEGVGYAVFGIANIGATPIRVREVFGL